MSDPLPVKETLCAFTCLYVCTGSFYEPNKLFI